MQLFKECSRKSCCFRPAMALFLVLNLVGRASAEYRYFDNAGAAHRKLVEDIRSGQVDTTNLSPIALSAAQQIAPLLTATDRPELKVCQTLEIQYGNGGEFSFRSFLGNSMLDWVVKASRSPQIVISIVALPARPTPGGAAPAVLPPFTPGGNQTLVPPTQLGCGPVLSRRPSDLERLDRCKRWPEMCREQP
jgi:hypothetical protein